MGDIEGVEICGFELYSISHCRYFVSSFEEGHSVIKTIPSNEDVLIKQLMSHSRPLVGHMTEDNQLSVYHNRPLLVSYMDLSWDLHAKSTYNNYRIACNFRGVKISFILKKEIFVSKNFVFRAAVEGGGARLGFSWVKNFVEVSSLTKITRFLPHENYTLYGIISKYVRCLV